MTTVIINIKQLVNIREENKLLRGKELAELPIINDAYLVVGKGLIVDYGSMNEYTIGNKQWATSDELETIDAVGATILPTYCDSHTHIVFAASRENEFVDKINGLSYADIAAKGGGILNSAAKLANTSEDELFEMACNRLKELM